MKILKRDFDAAVRQPWGTNTCIVAQCMIRNGIRIRAMHSAHDFALEHDIRRIQREFDLAYCEPHSGTTKALQDIRASLPISFK